VASDAAQGVERDVERDEGERMQLRGKVAVVTGASSGIGEATARRLAAEGMRVVAVARRQERLEALAATAPGVTPHAADVTQPAEVMALADRVAQELGACHVLVNDAGVGGGPFRGAGDVDDALRTIEVNLHGPIRLMGAFHDLLAASAPSRVINVASVAGKLGIGPAGYAASKFGLVGLSEATNLSWAPEGITVTQLNPGFIATEGFPQTEIVESPLGRIVGRPEDVAAAVVAAARSGARERTVPRGYRAAVALRHLAPAIFWPIARRMGRASGARD
jgi:NAD(P)-dependent dehydrogenase (short-subunit alcohol dehydrogenase family)